MDDLFMLADKLHALRDEKDAQTAILKDIEKDIRSAECRLIEAMTQAGCSDFTRNGKRYIMTSTTRRSLATKKSQ